MARGFAGQLLLLWLAVATVLAQDVSHVTHPDQTVDQQAAAERAAAVQDALTKLQSSEAHAQQLAAQLQQLQSQYATAQADSQQAQHARSTLETDKQQLTEQLQSAAQQSAALQHELTSSREAAEQAKRDLDTAQEQLHALQAALAEAKTAGSGDLAAALQHNAALQHELENIKTHNAQLASQLQDLTSQLSEAKKRDVADKLAEATAEVEKLRNDANKAMTQHNELERTIQSHKKQAGEWQAKAAAAEKALEAARAHTAQHEERMRELEASLDHWVPLWLQHRINTTSHVVSSHLRAASQTAAGGSIKGFVEPAVAFASRMWHDAQPHLRAAYSAAQTSMQRLLKEHYPTVQRYTDDARAKVSDVLSSIMNADAVKTAASKLQTTVDEVQRFIRTTLRRYPSLQPFAKPEYELLITIAVFAAPLLAFITAISSLFGGSKSRNAPKPASSSTSRGDSVSSTHKKKAKQGSDGKQVHKRD